MKAALLLLASIACTFSSLAQKNDGKVVLTKGQKIIIKTSSTQDADMGMGMEMKNFSSSQNNLVVLDADDTSYSITNTLTGLKISMDMMGQTTSYDSDKKEDSASEIGKSIPNLNIPDTVTMNKYSRAVNARKRAEPVSTEDTNPLENMFQAFNNNKETVVSEAFFLIPKGKKVGDKWSDSSSTKDTKSYKEYVLQSIDNGIATILENSKIENNTQTEIQGMQVTVSMSAKSTIEIKVDSNTGLVNKRETKTDLAGNLEMMGQSVPVTGKGTITTTYEH